MRYIKNKDDLEEIRHYIGLAAEEAKKSTCKKSQRGAIIVKNDVIIGRGHNQVTLARLCDPCIRERITGNGHVELCSAIHAEQMAIIDSSKSGKSLTGARMYHIKTKNGRPVTSGVPSCTVCSRMIYQAGMDVVLLHKEGYTIYCPDEFNDLSFKYFL